MLFRRRNQGNYIKFTHSLRDPAMRRVVAVLVAVLIGQGLFWNYSRIIKPEMTIVPDVPGERTVRALAFGDEQAFFRLLALNIQIAGDTFGRFTALYKYDYNKLYHWFRLLNGLDNQSNYLPAMGAYYYSQSQNPKDVKYIVDFLDEYTDGRVKETWWWVTQAVYLSNFKLQDKDRALQMANRLRGVTGIPMWAQQMPAFIHEQRGEFDEAAAIIEQIAKNPDQYTQGELNFMMYFVKERLNRFDQLKQEFEKVQQEKAKQRALGLPEPEQIGLPDNVGAPTLGAAP
jgi:tetratricopeptide (TPR) repeat protein